MRSYKDILGTTLSDGDIVNSRAGAVTRISHEFWTHDLRYGFPAITSRKLAFKSMAGELACFLKGYTDISEFHARNCKIWDKNLADHNKMFGCEANTDLGPIYGAQWRNFGGVDQLREVIGEAKANPASRRLLVSAWNPGQMDQMVLPPCHYAFQLSIVKGHLDLMFHMRSVDLALGFPFDVASYALLTHLIANELGLIPRWLTGTFGDAHIYHQNIEGVLEYVSRPAHKLPDLQLHCPKGMRVEEFEPSMADLINYNYELAIDMGEMAN